MKQKKTRFYHALISITAMAILIFVSVIIFDAEPQIPLIFGCLIAGLVAFSIGYSWEEMLGGMIQGISQSLEAILILLLIGVLIGIWVASGTVPAMIYYGLQLLSAKYFLFAAAFICAIIACVIGAWGTVGTVGLAFMGIGLALEIPAPIVAGSIVTGSYFGEIVSPLSDATNLTAGVVGCDVFSLMKKILPVALTALSISEILYLAIGLHYHGDQAEISNNIDPLLACLRENFSVSFPALLPMIVMAACIFLKLPAIPSVLGGIISGFLIALSVQGTQLGRLLSVAFSGYVSQTGHELADTLLSTGGLESMMYTISIIIVAMAFGGLMRATHQMEAFVTPVVKHIHKVSGLTTLTVVSCIGMNILLPDQYLGISVPGQMYAQECDKRGISRAHLGRILLCGGAVTSPAVPWNTCGIYCMSILGVSATKYLPYAYISFILPILLVALTFFQNSRQKRA